MENPLSGGGAWEREREMETGENGDSHLISHISYHIFLRVNRSASLGCRPQNPINYFL